MRQLLVGILLLTATLLLAQTNGIEYKVEAQASISDSKTPLWLNANKYGLSSLEKTNGYLRGSVIRPLTVDSGRNWGIGYGVDIVGAVHHSSKFIVHQAFMEGRWLKGTLTIGAKEYPMELKNNQLSSGSQTFGINARPVPQVRLALPDYWQIPFFKGWLHLKGHIAYGKTTDDGWQKDFTKKNSHYTENTLYHSKAGYLKIENAEKFPLSIEMGLEMACVFGGTSYRIVDGEMTPMKNSTDIKSYWHAFYPSGGEVNEMDKDFHNEEGNHLGSWVARINYNADTWNIGVYADKYFEDHSSMLQLDYDGFGEGEEWNVRKKQRYVLYDFKDWMLGAELHLKNCSWLKGIVVEYLYTKYQSGPIYYDHNAIWQDHVGGCDNFYNHGIHTGWQHWGQVMGNPLYLSPIYNENSQIHVTNNRFMAFHLGMNGSILPNLDYRVLATWQDGLGTYSYPYTERRYNTSFLAEATYRFTQRTLRGWSLKGAYAMDFGKICGDNTGFQLTITKTGFLTR